MEIVIEIPEKVYNALTHTEFDANLVVDEMRKAIANGTPLPEHHGRLIDGDKVLDEIEKQYPASVSETDKRKRYARLVYYWAVKNAPTIIEGSERE